MVLEYLHKHLWDRLHSTYVAHVFIDGRYQDPAFQGGSLA